MKKINRNIVEILFFSFLHLIGMYLYWHYGLGLEMKNVLLLYFILVVMLIVQKLFASKVSVPLFDKEYKEYQERQKNIEEGIKNVNETLENLKLYENEKDVDKIIVKWGKHESSGRIPMEILEKWIVIKKEIIDGLSTKSLVIVHNLIIKELEFRQKHDN